MSKTSWNQVLDNLLEKIDTKNYNKYIKNLYLKKIENSFCVLSTHSKILKTHIEKKYKDDIKQAFFKATGKKIDLRVDVNPKDIPQNYSLKSFINESLFTSNFEPNPDYKFENFVVGKNNRLAFQASKQTCQRKNTTINPIYIFGKTGSGKTHLLHSIANNLLEKNPKINIKYTDILSFVSEFRFVVAKKESLEKFKNQYLAYDVLLIDDIQYLTETAIKSQEELLYIFNILYSKKKKIILAADRPINDLSINNDLKSRFMSGIQVSIETPNCETRKKILSFYNEKLNINLNNECISYISENVSDDTRNMLGLLNDISLYKLTDSLLFISLETVASIMENRSYLRKEASFQEDSIIQKVCSEYKVDIKDVMGKSRKKDFVIPRHISMYLLFHFYSINKNQISKIFQCRHSTVINAIKSVQKKAKYLPKINQTIDLVKKIFPF